jgi:peptidoglycan/xylan/chitin deacetylase (PgdA/CDA1 family)
VGRRERFAELLHRAGALGAMMELRRRTPGPPTVAILTYHHVADDDGNYPFDRGVADATPAQFRRQMEMLARYCTPIAIDDLIRALDGAPLPHNPVMVTFDDGYRSCHDTALPILQSVGLPATFFIATSFVTERRLYWWERIAVVLQRAGPTRGTLRYPSAVEITADDPGATQLLNDLIKNTPHLDLDRFLDGVNEALGVPWDRDIERELAGDLIMTWDHVRALAKAGMDIESHSRHHRVLQTLDDTALRDELEGSRRDLEAQVGRPVRAIAYPVGRRVAREQRIRDAIRDAGYRIGLTNSSGSTRVWPAPWQGVMAVDPFDVKRLSTERSMSEAMWFTQVAVPRLAYINKYNRD